MRLLFRKILKRIDTLMNQVPAYHDLRAGDAMHYLADISKAHRLHDDQPAHTINEGLDVSLDWYVQDLLER